MSIETDEGKAFYSREEYKAAVSNYANHMEMIAKALEKLKARCDQLSVENSKLTEEVEYWRSNDGNARCN